ncbi:fatty acid synthase, putative [Ixodes scapularis]|uniref:Fatty acid synthase, putative n=1 Tax=Ixodes scapularis TaxID=6945 RepID=B7P2U7_IXOSC|nr:fatty acid synthase, putative [Ixodes scapularis]|eukprot:XP_002403028.1 fatty acid synthase, putative [Ixodes scapularis]
METGTIPGNLHFNEPNPGIPSLNDGSIRVVHRHTPFPGGLVGINSVGLGGANVHTILEANPGPHVDSIPREKPQLPRLVLIAGRTQESLTVRFSGAFSLGEKFGDRLGLRRGVSTDVSNLGKLKSEALPESVFGAASTASARGLKTRTEYGKP